MQGSALFPQYPVIFRSMDRALQLTPMSWGIIRETLRILLEGTPASMPIETMVEELQQLPGVATVHDLHIWSLSSNVHAL